MCKIKIETYINSIWFFVSILQSNLSDKKGGNIYKFKCVYLSVHILLSVAHSHQKGSEVDAMLDYGYEIVFKLGLSLFCFFPHLFFFPAILFFSYLFC